MEVEMEKPGLVRPHRVLMLPPGFRFHPTDEELVVQYLRRKVFRCSLPAAIIPEIQLSRYDPWDLPGGPDREKYFFNTREVKYPNGGRPNRASATGYWKATGTDRKVVASGGGHQVVGMKKTLVFYRGKAPNGYRTDWVMHEYRLAGAGQRQNPTLNPTAGKMEEDWVLCRIFQKRRPAGTGVAMEASFDEAVVGSGRAGFVGFVERSSASSASPSDSESSCVTEVSGGRCSGEDSNCSSASSSSSSSSFPRRAREP